MFFSHTVYVRQNMVLIGLHPVRDEIRIHNRQNILAILDPVLSLSIQLQILYRQLLHGLIVAHFRTLDCLNPILRPTGGSLHKTVFQVSCRQKNPAPLCKR